MKKFFESTEEIKGVLSGKQPVLFLDYDGTLTPIVDTPDLAIISDAMRQTVLDLSRKLTVAVVSGRATDDVKSKVRIDGIYYAGSHGFEIVDPQGQVTINEEAQKARTVIDQVHAELSEMVKDIEGALIENVKYTISAHYRLVKDEDFVRFEEQVNKALEKYPQLRKTSGKKVFELRPRIDWDKGKAVQWIMSALGFDPDKQAAIYIGDDTTDEDAFAVLGGSGFGILVAEEERPSKAGYVVRNTEDVQKTLQWFMDNATGDSS